MFACLYPQAVDASHQDCECTNADGNLCHRLDPGMYRASRAANADHHFGKLVNTELRDPITVPLSIVTPGAMMTFAATQASSSINDWEGVYVKDGILLHCP